MFISVKLVEAVSLLILEGVENELFIEERRTVGSDPSLLDLLSPERVLGKEKWGIFIWRKRPPKVSSSIFNEGLHNDPNLHSEGVGDVMIRLEEALLFEVFEHLAEKGEAEGVLQGKVLLDFIEVNGMVLGEKLMVKLQIRESPQVGLGKTT